MDCHTVAPSEHCNIENGSIALIGNPNVGKSVLFQKMTGQRVIVSNYPGTTVEIARGAAKGEPECNFLDTPGVVTLPSTTEDEQVTVRVLLEEPLNAILLVGDAKNLRRTLLLTVQIAEMGIPMVLALNMMDEAKEHGVCPDIKMLSETLDVPIIPTTATKGAGVLELQTALKTLKQSAIKISYPPEIKGAISKLSDLLPKSNISPTALALLWLGGDSYVKNWIENHVERETLEKIKDIYNSIQPSTDQPPAFCIQDHRAAFVDQVLKGNSSTTNHSLNLNVHKLSRLTTHPVWGVGILAIVLIALYWFVGLFGAGTLVGLLEEKLFGELINPWFSKLVSSALPNGFMVDFIVGEYGFWTMGMTYSLALILPIVSTFFLAFGVMEDSGYLPRLAALSNQAFRRLGLNGKAVLPMVLGLGCVTMATLTTRVLETKREKFLVTLLLALAIPCSAQLGVVMGLLAGISFGATVIWGGVIILVLLLVGRLAAQLTPGERSPLLIELPPLRWPQASNVLMKTFARLEWYLKEVVPLFLLGSGIMFALDKSGILPWLNHMLEPLVVNWLGLPSETAAVFLMGFIRRDFGATGLFIMEANGMLTPIQAVVAMVTVTLFIPCVASVFMIARERGKWTAAGMVVLIFPLAFLVAGILNKILFIVGWGL